MADAPTRRRDPEGTRRDILAVATAEFAEHGYHGCRVDEIAARTRTTKRMIYYYFGDKDTLYAQVIERAYQQIRDVERTISVDDLAPTDAVRALAERTFDHHEAHPEFIRLVSVENLNRGRHLAASSQLQELNSPAIGIAERILERGYRSGEFVRRVEPVDLHMLISAFCFFRVANQHTFAAIFGVDLTAPDRRPAQRAMLADLVVDHLAGRGG